MSSNYPEGSMRGSGIYAQEEEKDFTCDDCGNDFTEVLVSDDWGNYDSEVECPKCQAKFTYTESEPDYVADRQSWEDDNHDN